MGASPKAAFVDRYYMKRSVIFFILGCYLVVFSNTSLQMYSIEAGKLYTENYNIIHVLNSSSGCCNPFALNKDSMPRNQDSTHFHIQKPNSQYPDDGNWVNFSFNNLPTTLSFHQQSNNYPSQVILLTHFFSRFKIIPLSRSYSSDSVVLRI